MEQNDTEKSIEMGKNDTENAKAVKKSVNFAKKSSRKVLNLHSPILSYRVI